MDHRNSDMITTSEFIQLIRYAIRHVISDMKTMSTIDKILKFLQDSTDTVDESSGLQ